MNQWESADAPAASTVYSSLSAKGTVKVSWLLLLLVLLVVLHIRSFKILFDQQSLLQSHISRGPQQ